MTENNIAEPTEESTSTAPPTTDVAKVERPKAQLQAHEGGVMAIMPRNIEEAQRYASGLIAAGIVPDAFKFSKDVLRAAGEEGPPLARKGDVNAPLVLMGVLKSLEIGVPPQTGLGGLLPLNGRFSVWGDLAAALVQRTGKVKDQTVSWFGPAIEDESAVIGSWPSDFGCEVRYWRVGQEQPYIGRFTVRDAKRAGLVGRDIWVKYPKRMLYNRARALALRDGFADALAGLTIAEEVLDSMPDVVEERAPSKVTALLRDDGGNDE